MHENLYLAAETDLDAIITHVSTVQPRLLIIDSVQTIAARDVDGVTGGVTQVREVAAALTSVAKDKAMSTILVGHVTKDGSVAGPRTLEHLVDVVLHFEGDRHSRLRMVRAEEQVRADRRGRVLRPRRVRPDRARGPERAVPLPAP